MVVTPFGDMRLDDPISIERFIDAHARRHRIYVPLTHVNGGTLRGTIDGDWMHRHWARHVSLATAVGFTDGDLGTKTLALPGFWRTQQELIDWSELHNRIHIKLDRLLKVH
jgi:hypothetical protein